MKSYTDNDVIKFIEQELNKGNPISLRAVGNYFNTSHSQIKRILIRNNYYEEYLRKKEEIIIQREDDNENIIDQEQEVYGVKSDIDDYIKELIEEAKDVNRSIELKNLEDVFDTGNQFKDIMPLIYRDRNGVGFICDVHLGHHDTQALSVALEYLKDRRVKKLVLGGDILDNESVSYWKSRGVLTFKEEVDLTKEFLEQIKSIFPKQDIIFIAGNHSLRYESYILSHVKQLYELETFRLEKILDLDKYDIQWIDNRDYIKKHGHPFKVGKLNYLHGHEIKCSWGVVNIARIMFLRALDNIIFGHFHQTQEYISKDINNQIKGSWSVGCLCRLNPDYSCVNTWNQGCAYIEYDENWENFRVYNKKIIDGDIF